MRRRFITLLVIVLIAVLLALLFFFWQAGSGRVSHTHGLVTIYLFTNFWQNSRSAFILLILRLA